MTWAEDSIERQLFRMGELSARALAAGRGPVVAPVDPDTLVIGARLSGFDSNLDRLH
jgi:hypothetical protein